MMIPSECDEKLLITAKYLALALQFSIYCSCKTFTASAILVKVIFKILICHSVKKNVC